MIIKQIFILFLFIISSCNLREDDKKCKYFDENGHEVSYKDDSFFGFKECYYKNGNIKERIYYTDNQLDGKYEKYFKNGSLNISGYYNRNRLIGKWITYDSNNYNIKRKDRYILINDSSYLNEYFVYDSAGNIDYKKSNFFAIGIEKDTIVSGDFFKWQISSEATMWGGNFYLVLGSDLSIDSNYRITNKKQIDTLLYTKNATMGFKTPKQDSGKRIIRGILIEEKEGEEYIKQRKQFFSIEFYCFPDNNR